MVSTPQVKASLLAGLLLTSTACTSSSYMGISLLPGGSDPTLQQLAFRARAGDKHAQLDLGIRFEEGNGVSRSMNRAIRLYRQAAKDSGGTIWVYVPSPGGSAPSRVISINKPLLAGLIEAKIRLESLTYDK